MQKKIARILVTLSAIFWGTNFNVGKMVMDNLSPMTAVASRFLLASLLIIPVICCLESKEIIKETVKRNNWIYIFLGTMGVAGFNALTSIGLKYTTAINAALIMATNPLVTTLLSVIFLKSSVNTSQRVGLMLSLIGVIGVITNGSLEVLLNFKIAMGDCLVMAGNICWALYSVLLRRFVHDSKPMITTAATMVIGTMALLVMASFNLEIPELFQQTSKIYMALLYMSIFGSVLAYFFWNHGIALLGAGTTAVFFNLVPVVTVLVAIIMGQAVTLVQMMSGLLVIFGVFLSTNPLNFSSLKGFLKKSAADTIVV